jgi:glycopeptide antibiotics resistance protein
LQPNFNLQRVTVLPPLRWAVLIAYMVLVTWASLAPARVFTGLYRLLPFPHLDKLFHFLLYGGLVAIARWTASAHWSFKPGYRLILAGAIGYGILMEVLQGIMVNYHRSFEFGDIIANSLGAIFFWVLYGLAVMRSQKV